MNGYTKPYFTDETGKLFRDETGLIDHVDPIPMEVELGRNNFDTDQRKRYFSVLVDSENAQGANLQYSVDGRRWITFRESINSNVQKLVFPQAGQLIEGRDINYRFVYNNAGSEPVFNGLVTYYTITEAVPNETR